jgi:antirestriction protein ArdC
MYKQHSTKVNYSEITDKICTLMEEGTLPMGSQWNTARNKSLPFNLSTGKMYNGSNVMWLWVEEWSKKYTSNGWITINQMRTIGKEEDIRVNLITLPEDAPNRGKSKTGQKGVSVFHAGSFIPKEWKLQDAETNTFRSDLSGDYADGSQIGKSYLKVVGTVYNLDQIENLPEKYKQFDKLKPIAEREPEINSMVESYNVPIEVSKDGRCFYRIDEHKIYLVHQEHFKSHTDFLRVLFHELTHSTGHSSLLARTGVQLGGDRSSSTYAFEELVAELGAAFLCAQFGIEGLMVHAEYIEHYVKMLRQDDRAIFRAASKAQAAVDLLMSHLPIQKDNPHEENKIIKQA